MIYQYRRGMFENLVDQIKQEDFQRNGDHFSYFESRSINRILKMRKTEEVVLFRDLEFLDDETEFIKRCYSPSEATSRIRKLLSYYRANMAPPTPNLLVFESYPVLERRNKKLLILAMKRDRSETKPYEGEDEASAYMILSQLEHSYSTSSTDKSQENANQIQFEEVHYDTYEVHAAEGRGREVFNLNEAIDSRLILEFKPGEDRYLDLALSQQLPQDFGMQLSIPTAVSREIYEEGKRFPHGMGYVLSQPNSKNLVESIEIKKEVKKGSTFMDYYNSIPVKNPSNILQKYIRRKK